MTGEACTYFDIHIGINKEAEDLGVAVENEDLPPLTDHHMKTANGAKY